MFLSCVLYQCAPDLSAHNVPTASSVRAAASKHGLLVWPAHALHQFHLQAAAGTSATAAERNQQGQLITRRFWGGSQYVETYVFAVSSTRLFSQGHFKSQVLSDPASCGMCLQALLTREEHVLHLEAVCVVMWLSFIRHRCCPTARGSLKRSAVGPTSGLPGGGPDQPVLTAVVTCSGRIFMIICHRRCSIISKKHCCLSILV